MRKFVVFLLVFAAGLALVLTLRTEKPAPPAPAPEDSARATKPAEFTEIPVPSEKPDRPSSPLGISLDGKLDLIQRAGTGATLKPHYELHADDVDLVGDDVYELHGLTILVYNLDTDAVRARMTSASSRLKLAIVDGSPRIGDQDRAELTSVELTLNEGAPIVPLTLEIPRVEWQLARNRFTSDERVRLRGQGLAAEGVGLDADLSAARLVLPHEAVIRLDIGPTSQAVISTTGPGPLQVEQRTVDARPQIDLIASQGARLALTGERAVEVTADSLQLHGRQNAAQEFDLIGAEALGQVVLTSQGNVFRSARADFHFDALGKLESAHLEGQVVLEGGGDVFRAESADFRFDPRGMLVHADLVGAPSGTVQIGRLLPESLTGGRDAAEGAQAEISGVGPLALDFGDATALDLQGPGEMRVPSLGFALDAQRSLRGSLEKDHRSGALVADGAVRMHYQESDLASEKLAIRFVLTVPGAEAVDAVAEGFTTLHGAVPGGTPITLEAREGMSVRSRGRQLFVPEARAVKLIVPDPEGFEARAALVRDFDWRARTFEAIGDVAYAGRGGRGSATRAVSHGRDDVELFGVAGAPAHYEFEREGSAPVEARTEALEIHVRKDALDAAGAVKAAVAAADKSYALESGRLHLDLAAAPAAGALRPFHAEAEDGVRTQIQFEGGRADLKCDKLFVDGVLKEADALAAGRPVTKSDVRAAGHVSIDYRAAGQIVGECDLFTLDREGRGRLSAEPGQSVHARGRLATGIAPYSLTAEWLEFDSEHLDAHAVAMTLEEADLSDAARRALEASAPVLELSTERFHADATQILLQGKAHAKGRSVQGEEWWIDAGSLRLQGRWVEGQSLTGEALEGVHAWDGFEATLGTRAHTSGDRLDGDPKRVRIEGAPARMAMSDFEWESAWIQFERDNMLLSTDRGLLRPRADPSRPNAPSWSVTYESMQPFDRDDATILVLRNPLFRSGDDEMRADWSLFWVDREQWMKSGQRALDETTGTPDLRVRVPEPTRTPAKHGKAAALDPLAGLADHPLARILSEVYVEGNIELLRAGERKVRSSAIYLDIVEGRGWIQDADILIDVNIRGRKQRLRTKADWLRISKDRTLRADNAVITSCDYDDPHYVIKTGELEIGPTPDGGYSVSAKQNELAFGDTVAIPMPPLVAATDKDFVPLMDKIVAGNLAKFGTSVQASFNFALGGVGRGIGSVFGKFLGFPDADLNGHWKFRPGYLGSRGVILGTGLEFDVPGRFSMDMAIDGIPDSAADKGLVRVPTDDRSTLRTWFRTRGRYTTSPTEWFDVAVSIQSDPGVQSEFFERDYLEYEQKDNYVHWRKANDQYYFNASAKVLLEDRTDIEELPSVGAYRGLTPIGSIGDLPILYRAYADVAYLRRRNGDPRYYAPFDPPFESPNFEDPLGGPIGDRNVLRADTEHRFEAPFAVGFAALRATPFVAARATAWDEGVDPDSAPTRIGLFAGVDLSTTLWKRYGHKTAHTLTPVVSFHTDVATDQSGGDVVPFDRVEDSIEGSFVDVGLRSRLWKLGTKEHFDLDVRTTHASGVQDGATDGFRPVAVLTEFLTFAGDVPIGMTHDGRYATDDGDTVYSRSFLGFEPHPKLGIEFGYHRGLDVDGVRLYEAASVGTRFRATPKWEIELDETVSIADNRGLGHNFLLRRLGHDFIMEVGVTYRAGEGAGFGINVIPDLSFKRSSLGLIDRWLGVYR